MHVYSEEKNVTKREEKNEFSKLDGLIELDVTKRDIK